MYRVSALVFGVLLISVTASTQTVQPAYLAVVDSTGTEVGPVIGGGPNDKGTSAAMVIDTARAIPVGGVAFFDFHGIPAGQPYTVSHIFPKAIVMFEAADCSSEPLMQLGVAQDVAYSASSPRFFLESSNRLYLFDVTTSSESVTIAGRREPDDPSVCVPEDVSFTYIRSVEVISDLSSVFTPPYTVDYRQHPCLFADCFNSGTTGAWSNAIE